MPRSREVIVPEIARRSLGGPQDLQAGGHWGDLLYRAAATTPGGQGPALYRGADAGRSWMQI